MKKGNTRTKAKKMAKGAKKEEERKGKMKLD